MRKFLLIIFALCLTISSKEAYAQDELDNYLIDGAKNNPMLKSKFNQYLAALEVTNIVGKLPDPQVAFAFFILPVETRLGPQRFKLSASQMFPWFGTLNAEKSLATERAKVKFESFEQSRSQLYYDIKMSYYTLYFFARAIEITQENINILNTLQRLSVIKYEAGMASVVDEYRVEMEINDLDNQLQDLIENTAVLQVKFNQLLNIESTSEIVVLDSLWQEELPGDKQEILDSVLANNNQIELLEQRLVAQESEKVLAQKMGALKFGLGVDYIMIGESSSPSVDPNLNGRDAFVFPKISLTLPLYRSKYSAMVNKVSIEMESTNDDIASKRNVLTTLFEKGYKDYTDALRRIELNKKQSKLAEKSLNILTIQYSTNGKNFEEVLRMESKRLKYRLALQKGYTDLNASVAFIEFLMGK